MWKSACIYNVPSVDNHSEIQIANSAIVAHSRRIVSICDNIIYNFILFFKQFFENDQLYHIFR